MEFFGLKDALKSYCNANSIMFVYGRSDLREVHLQNVIISESLKPGKYVLFAGFASQPSILGKVNSCNYQGVLMLGRHCEADTSSSLDETQEQKYDRRLSDIESKLAEIIGEFACSNELEIVNTLQFEEVINQFDENLDCIETSITFSH